MQVIDSGTDHFVNIGRSDNWTANNPLGTIYVGDVSVLGDVQRAYVDRIAFGDGNESLSSMLVPEPATIGLLAIGFVFLAFGFGLSRRRR
ncbi:MAG: PEP-CTERM sorting domain-containing protein [Planctomycetota bacterium]|nr:PEP-CTERM sorting domain-containing protein [Planctomycetota bacterium]